MSIVICENHLHKWGHSSAGRALRSQRKGRGFESRCLHDQKGAVYKGHAQSSFIYCAFCLLQAFVLALDM